MFHATRHKLLTHVVGQGKDEAVKSRLTAWNIKVYDGAHSCLRHFAVLLQINTACFCTIYFYFILALIPNLPLFSLSLILSDLNYFKLNIFPMLVCLILLQLIIPEGYQYKASNYKFCPASYSFIRVTPNPVLQRTNPHKPAIYDFPSMCTKFHTHKQQLQP